jgi:hypothetical protein
VCGFSCFLSRFLNLKLCENYTSEWWCRFPNLGLARVAKVLPGLVFGLSACREACYRVIFAKVARVNTNSLYISRVRM